MRNFWKSDSTTTAATERGHEPLAQGLKTASEIGAFPDLSESDLVRLFNRAALVKRAAGERLFEADASADRLFILLAGEVELRQMATAFTETLHPGDWICDVDYAEPYPRNAEATALTAVTALAIDGQAFADFNLSLREYLTERMARLNLHRLRRVSAAHGALQARNAGLIEALFSIHTRHGVGFASTPPARQLFAKVPALPVSTLTLLNKMLDERTTKAEIVELVTMDPALTSTLLKAANSPLYGLQHKVTNVSHAIVLLGHNIVYQVIMSESMRRSLPETPFFAEIHRRAVEISRLAFTLSQALGVAKPAEVATIGILNDIGLVVIELLKTFNPRLSLLFDFVDPAEMGAELLRSWNLPEALCESLRYQRYPEFATPDRIPPEVRASVSLLYLARRCYQTLHETDVGVPSLFIAEYLAVLGAPDLSEEELLYERVVPRLRAQLHQLPLSLAEVLRA